MTAWIAPVWLVGRFVALEPLEPRHLDELRPIVRDSRVFTHLTVDLGTPGALERWHEQAEAAATSGDQLVFVKRLVADGRLVGSTRYLNIAAPHRRLEIGWTWLVPAVWGGPVNTESKLLLLAHAFEHLGAHRVEFRTDSRNVRSQAAIAALGAVKEGVFRRHMVVKDGFVRDTMQFAIVDQDWPAIRARLEARLAAKAGGSA